MGELTETARPTEWRPFETAPNDGTQFLVHYIDFVDEYDEDDRLIARNVPTPSIGVAQQDPVFGLMDVPWRGCIYSNRQYTHWMPLPSPPSTKAEA
jgi:hypothetical protein